MKILMVAPPAFPVSKATGNSVEICMYEIGRRLASHHEVTILSRRSKGLPYISQSKHFRIVRISKEKGYTDEVIRYIKKNSFDVIQVDNRPKLVPLLRSHFPLIPIVLILHSLTFMHGLNHHQKISVMDSVTKVVCNSRFIKKYYSERFPTYSRKLSAIHLGTDLKRFRKPTSKEKEKQRVRYKVTQTYNLLYTGRVIPQKGIEVLIKAASHVKNKFPNIQIVLVGPVGKSYKHKLNTLAKRKNVPLTFTGKINASSMHQVYWLGDCFICPTQFHEAFGLVNVEAMASGLPVIASHRGGLPEILGKQNGILVRDYKNPKAFSNAIIKIMSSTTYARSLATAGYKTAHKKYGWDRVASDYHRFYSRKSS